MGAPRYLRLDEAARKYGISAEALLRVAESGLVRAVRINGSIAVAEDDIKRLGERNGHSVLEFPRYIPLSEASRRYGLSEVALKRGVESGTIEAIYFDEEVAVLEGDVKKLATRQELWQQVQSLDGVPITIDRACKKYGISKPSLYRWIQQGFIRVLHDQRGGKRGGRGNKRLLNEADVAYAALVADIRNVRRGQRTFTREYWPPHVLS